MYFSKKLDNRVLLCLLTRRSTCWLTYTPWGYILYCMNTAKQKLTRRLKIIEGQVRGLQELIEKGYKQVQKFSWHKTAQKYLQILEEVTA
mgnify:CR=1 FL=1